MPVPWHSPNSTILGMYSSFWCDYRRVGDLTSTQKRLQKFFAARDIEGVATILIGTFPNNLKRYSEDKYPSAAPPRAIKLGYRTWRTLVRFPRQLGLISVPAAMCDSVHHGVLNNLEDSLALANLADLRVGVTRRPVFRRESHAPERLIAQHKLHSYLSRFTRTPLQVDYNTLQRRFCLHI